jgi:hypothetical protein
VLPPFSSSRGQDTLVIRLSAANAPLEDTTARLLKAKRSRGSDHAVISGQSATISAV